MQNNKTPDPNTIHPIPGYDKEIYVKPTIKNPQLSLVILHILQILILKAMLLKGSKRLINTPYESK